MTIDPSGSRTLVLGIGNTLLGDEGVGGAVIDHLHANGGIPADVGLLDGGTGSMVLLEPMREARRMILVGVGEDDCFDPSPRNRREQPGFHLCLADEQPSWRMESIWCPSGRQM